MREARRGPRHHDGWTTPVSSALGMAGFLGVVLIGFTLLAAGPLMAIDTYFNLEPPPPAWLTFLHVLDRIGQRAVCLPILAVVVGEGGSEAVGSALMCPPGMGVVAASEKAWSVIRRDSGMPRFYLDLAWDAADTLRIAGEQGEEWRLDLTTGALTK